jgi:uncharacterized membrane protein HdeD (DUF308 family)
MAQNFSKYFLIPKLVGYLTIILGVFLFFAIPTDGISLIAVLFIIMIFGLIEIIFYYNHKKHLKGWSWYILGILAAIAPGFVIFFLQQDVESDFNLYLGFCLLFRCCQGLGFAAEIKYLNIHWHLLLIDIFATLSLSVLIILFPFTNLLTFSHLIGLAIIAIGFQPLILVRQFKKLPFAKFGN